MTSVQEFERKARDARLLVEQTRRLAHRFDVTRRVLITCLVTCGALVLSGLGMTILNALLLPVDTLFAAIVASYVIGSLGLLIFGVILYEFYDTYTTEVPFAPIEGLKIDVTPYDVLKAAEVAYQDAVDKLNTAYDEEVP